MSALFSPFQLKDITLRNRLAVAPMCQYQSENGFVSDWHLSHYTGLARGGAGLVVVEATGVSPEGRITPACLGIWDDAHLEGLSQIARAIKAAGAVPGIQIAHAGRKASAARPWEGGAHLPPSHPLAWQPIGPSALPFGGDLDRSPTPMTEADIARVQADFVRAAKRALEAGFEWLELHFAHGYLGQSFFSVHSNQREDGYGQTLEGRNRFLLETLAAVRIIWPERLPLDARFGVIEFDGRDEETLEESIVLAKAFKAGGLDFLNVSVGFSTPKAQIPWGPAFLAPYAARIRQEVGLPVAASWGIDEPLLMERLIAEGQLDLVMVGKAFLANPNYPYQCARALHIERPSWVLPASYAHWLERYQR